MSTTYQAQVLVSMDALRELLGLPEHLRPMFVQTTDDQDAVKLIVDGATLDDIGPVVPAHGRPALRQPMRVKQSFSVDDGGPAFERCAMVGSAEAGAMGGLTPRALAAAVAREAEKAATRR